MENMNPGKTYFEVATAMHPEEHLQVIRGAEERVWFNPIPHPRYSVEMLRYTRRTIQGDRVTAPKVYEIYDLPTGACMPFETVDPDNDGIPLWTITTVWWKERHTRFEGRVHVTERRGFGGMKVQPVESRTKRVE
jgi:hypothetical protein